MPDSLYEFESRSYSGQQWLAENPYFTGLISGRLNLQNKILHLKFTLA